MHVIDDVHLQASSLERKCSSDDTLPLFFLYINFIAADVEESSLTFVFLILQEKIDSFHPYLLALWLIFYGLLSFSLCKASNRRSNLYS
jgi:hypothetical protein